MQGMTDVSVEEFKDMLEQLIWQQGVSSFRITEDSNNGIRKFLVEDLQVEIEDDVIMCTDSKDILLLNRCTLTVFLHRQLLSIHKIMSSNFIGVFEFQDNSVLVEAL